MGVGLRGEPFIDKSYLTMSCNQEWVQLFFNDGKIRGNAMLVDIVALPKVQSAKSQEALQAALLKKAVLKLNRVSTKFGRVTFDISHIGGNPIRHCKQKVLSKFRDECIFISQIGSFVIRADGISLCPVDKTAFVAWVNKKEATQPECLFDRRL